MANTIQSSTSMTTNINGSSVQVSSNFTTQTTSSNYISGDETITSSVWTNIPFSTLNDVISFTVKNDNSNFTASLIGVATGSTGQGQFAIIQPGAGVVVPWSGSYNGGNGIYVKVIAGYPNSVATTPNSGAIIWNAQQS